MHAFSRSLARAVKNARDKMNLTQEQVGELVDTNTRTISSIENGKSNTRMNILYPLVRVLRNDSNEIFYPETVADSSVKHQLRALIENCSDEEAAALLTTSESVLRVLRKQNAGKVEEKRAGPSENFVSQIASASWTSAGRNAVIIATVLVGASDSTKIGAAAAGQAA